MKEWEKFAEIGIDDDPELIRKKQEMERLVRWQGIIVIGGIGGMIAAAIVTWMNAPPVGGEWWFYLRFIVVGVASLAGFAVGRLVTFLVLVLTRYIAKRVGDGS